MALDGIVTRAAVSELQQLVGGRIHKIHQPTAHDLVVQTRGAGGGRKLLISANPTYPRIHFTERSYQNPMEPPMFCMLLRKYCEGGQIEAVRQVGMERVIELDIRQRDELGDLTLKTIIIELMGRHSNIILVDTATRTIHDGIHHVTPAISSYRIVMPGTAYTAPPDQHKKDPLQLTQETDFARILSEAAGGEADEALTRQPLDKLLVAALSGFSPLLARELAYRAGSVEAGDGSELHRLWTVFSSFMESVRGGSYAPNIVETPAGKSYFSIIELTHLEGERRGFESMSQCLEAFYGEKASRDTVKQRVSDMIRFLQNEKAKNVKKVDKLNETLEEAKGADKYRILGELLTTYMHAFSKGDRSVELENYYDENAASVTIELDPQLSPSDNAQRYFRRYTKFRNSTEAVKEQMALAGTEIAYLDSLLQQLDTASLEDIEEIREELVAEGYLRARGKRGAKRKKAARPALLCYTSSEGIAIYVGKNNTQNEYLTNRLASQGDTWLHTKDIPGSHVVIRSAEFGNATLEEAAMLAARFSQARSSSMVPVDYTLIRHVHKPSGSKPGFVIYDRQKTLFITPDEARLQELPSVVKA